MKFVISIGAIITSAIAIGQVSILPGSYIFVRDQMLFVNQEINFQNTGVLYLRDNAQLLQGTTGLSSNYGPGEVSVFQEGTVDNFEYNYWCSPIGNSSNAIGNENFGISMIQRPVTLTTSAPAILLGNTIANGDAFPLRIAPMWVNKFLSSLNYSQWIPVYDTSTIVAGEGFTMKGTAGTDITPIYGVQNNPGSAQRYDFRGKPNDGNISINVGNGQFTLTGNPYPSAIDLSAFLTDALNCTGIAYFWEQDKTTNSHLIASYRGGYGTFSPISRLGSGIYVPAPFYAFASNGTQLGVDSTPMNSYARYFSPIGQGFLIEGNGVGPTVVMNNSYRVFQKENLLTSVFERGTSTSESAMTTQEFLPAIQSVSGFDYTTVSTAPVPQIRFNALLGQTGFRQFVLATDTAATDGVDHAMDARTPSENLPADIFFSIDQKEYVISVIAFDVNKRLPLGIKCTSETHFKLAVSEIVNFPAVQNVYVYDKLTGIYHDIQNGIFEITMPAGSNIDRFEMTFNDQLLGNPENSIGNLQVVQNNISQLFTVSNPAREAVRSISLYDISGKRVADHQGMATAAQYEYPTSGLAEGIYIVKIVMDFNKVFAQKISVFKSE